MQKKDKIKNLMKSIDYTNYRYGRSTLSLADAGLNKKWKVQRKQFSSKIDTADFYRSTYYKSYLRLFNIIKMLSR